MFWEITILTNYSMAFVEKLIPSICALESN